jgi:phosphoglycerate dehydrogenase-like enzyme
MDELLDDIARTLAAEGVEVLRGPESRGGGLVPYPPERWPEGHGRSTVAVFSNLNPCTRQMMLAAPQLKGIVFPTIGVEGADLEAASELGIPVANGATPENFVSMAEATVLMILMLLYAPLRAIDVMRGVRERPPLEHGALTAHMLMRRTVGLVGFGRIARAVAERLQGWNARLLAHAPSLKPGQAVANVETADLASLLRQSDVVCVLAPGGEATRRLIGEKELRSMKRGAYLVNTARGSIVDERALVAVLSEGHLAGAALDAFATEPLPKESPLRRLDNVILTPHMIGHTAELAQSLRTAALQNVRRLLAGEAPLHCVNPDAISGRSVRRGGAG